MSWLSSKARRLQNVWRCLACYVDPRGREVRWWACDWSVKTTLIKNVMSTALDGSFGGTLVLTLRWDIRAIPNLAITNDLFCVTSRFSTRKNVSGYQMRWSCSGSYILRPCTSPWAFFSRSSSFTLINLSRHWGQVQQCCCEVDASSDHKD